MDTMLLNGDFKRNETGKPYLSDGIDEVLQRCKIALSVRKGSYVYNRSLGSTLYSAEKSERAMELLVKETLLCVPQAEVISIHTETGKGSMKLTVTVSANGETGEIEVVI